MYPIHIFPPYSPKIYSRSSLWSLPLGFPTKTFHIFLICPICATFSAHLILFDLNTITIYDEANILKGFSLCSLLQPPATSFPLGPNIIHNTLFSKTLNLCSSFKVSGQVSHPYKTRSKIIDLCILMFQFLKSRRKDKRF
jgi:hypothetical protein